MATADIIENYHGSCYTIPNDDTIIDHECLRKYFDKLIERIKEKKTKKNNRFLIGYTLLVDCTFKINNKHINDILLIRHFLIQSVQEINNELSNNNEPYRVSFSKEFYHGFMDENKVFFQKYDHYNEDGTCNSDKSFAELNRLNFLVKKFVHSKEFYLLPELFEPEHIILRL